MKNEIEDTDDPRVVLTREQADQLIEPGEYVHTFLQGGGPGLILIGADSRRERILVFADEGKCELSGPSATAMFHGVVVFTDAGPLFVKTVVNSPVSTL